MTEPNTFCHFLLKGEVVKTYMYLFNGRRKYIDAETIEGADKLFMEKFGFSPEGLATVHIMVGCKNCALNVVSSDISKEGDLKWLHYGSTISCKSPEINYE